MRIKIEIEFDGHRLVWDCPACGAKNTVSDMWECFEFGADGLETDVCCDSCGSDFSLKCGLLYTIYTHDVTLEDICTK